MSSSVSHEYYYSDQQLGIDRRMKECVVRRCLPFINGPSILDLGYVDGMWTDKVIEKGWQSTIVEQHPRHVEHANERYGDNQNVTIYQSTFESFALKKSYNSIIAGDIIRYIHDTTLFLRGLKDGLAENGRLIVTVPNSRSLHRRIGTLMDMETHPEEANSTDKSVGNLRAYDRYQLRHELQSAGWRILELRGCLLKPLSSQQMTDWSDELIQAFDDISTELEDYAWFIYAICEAED